MQRDVVLDGRIAVLDQRDVLREQRAALGHDRHALDLRRLHDHLSLVAARLVVVFDAMRTLRLQAADVGERVVIPVDLGINAGRLGAIDDLARREDARREDQSGTLHFGRDENFRRARRGVVARRRPHREVDDLRPILLRDQFVVAVRAVRVRVDEAGDDRLAGRIDGDRARRDRDCARRTDCGDAVAVDDDRAIFDHAAVLVGHRHDLGAGDDDNTLMLRRRLRHRQRHTIAWRSELGRLFVDRCVREEARQIGTEQGRAAAPVEAAATVGPVHIFGAAAADARNGERPALGAERDILSAGHQRGDIGVVILPERQRAAVGRDFIVADQLAIGVDALVLTAHVGADELALAVAGGDHEDAVAGCSELRLGAVAADPFGGAAARGDTIDARILAPARRGQPAAAAPFEHNRLAIGGEAWFGIMAGVGGQLARCAAARANDVDFTHAAVGPAHEYERLAVARPAGPRFHRVVLRRGQPPSGAAGRGLDPQLAERLEHDAAPVGRHFGPARHFGCEAIRRDFDRRVRRIDDRAVVVDAERDDARVAAGTADAAQLAARPEEDVAAVRRPRHVRIDAGHGPGFLHVLVERVIDFLLGARGEILHIELRLRPFAAHEGEALAVGRGCRAHRAAGTRCRGADLAILKAVAFDMEEVGVAVLRIFEDRPRRDVARVEDALAVGGEDRLAELLLVALVRLLDQRNARAARDMV